MGEDSPKLPRQLQGFSTVLRKPRLFQLVLVELVLELQGRHVVMVDVGTHLSRHSSG